MQTLWWWCHDKLLPCTTGSSIIYSQYVLMARQFDSVWIIQFPLNVSRARAMTLPVRDQWQGNWQSLISVRHNLLCSFFAIIVIAKCARAHSQDRFCVMRTKRTQIGSKCWRRTRLLPCVCLWLGPNVTQQCRCARLRQPATEASGESCMHACTHVSEIGVNDTNTRGTMQMHFRLRKTIWALSAVSSATT